MTSEQDPEKLLLFVADESLTKFEEVAEAARASLARSTPESGASSFATINTATYDKAVRNLGQITHAVREGYGVLIREPAIARVVVIDEEGAKATYFFCRATPISLPDKSVKFASYRSPVGRLAELRVGQELEIPRAGKTVFVRVIENARFQPILSGHTWDSRNSILDGEEYGPLTVESLRALFKKDEENDGTALDRLLREEESAANIRDGVRRAVISRMDLRNQPVLDEYQGEIFRMPLDSRLLILGAPGTGKTTTLIHRLGQKLDLEHLGEDERRAVSRTPDVDHANSWIMFAPTELLRLYVKEAFNLEGIPAPDDRIHTWTEFREGLARNDFRILRSAVSRSAMTMKEGVQTLASGFEFEQVSWFTDFDGWQKAAFLEELRAAAKTLSGNASPKVAKRGKEIATIIETSSPTLRPTAFDSLAAVGKEITSLVSEMKAVTDEKIRGALNLQVNRSKSFLDELASFVVSLDDLPEDDTEQDGDEDEEASQPRVGRAAAVVAYMRAVRAAARARARRRSLPKSGPTGRLIEWLGERALGDQELLEVGESLVVQSALRVFVNPVRRYIDGVPARYRRFRRLRQSEDRWYRSDGFSPTDVHPLEVDAILLAMMRGTDELIVGARNLTTLGTPAHATLERMAQLYRTQVLVDEATDFSPIQLACMATLARPGMRSFFACGDFNQRITSWGTRSEDEVRWAAPDIGIRTVTIAYRQSGQLYNLARQIAALSGESEADAELPDFAENEGVPPVLVKGLADKHEIAKWLASRINEIERFVGELPSIAVLVESEEEVRPLAALLADALAHNNISVEACLEGKVRGRDSAVRVFDVQHIKGLEFEAVFYVGIDRLAKARPDLFDKYLYVGATRAATYLGLTCERNLPPSMGSLEPLFRQDWA
ncbi:ATP-binding domain-containing protein [Pelagibius sp. 7325]|uniref:ATP-binding domain-containing protein n=1 Tax=Pelagibius sp. 7325 TaxID=3131994 RepID=UPI0030ED2CEF